MTSSSADLAQNNAYPSTAGLIASHILQAIPGYQPPVALWLRQQQMYSLAWMWYTNEVFSQEDGRDELNEPVYRYPLKLGIRNAMRKHVSMLFGEGQNLPAPLVKTIISPKTPLQWTAESQNKGDDAPTEDEKLAVYCQNIVNEVWNSSSGRALMQQNALIGQYMGGSVFKVKYDPLQVDLMIPIVMEAIRPDFFYPIWSATNPDDLLEVFVCYYISSVVAKKEYGIDSKHSNHVIYIEHWTKDKYSIYFDGTPLTQVIAGETITFKDRSHDFGMVPYAYIPHLRESGYYGESHIPDIDGLMKELNARLSDEGMAIRKGIVPKYKYINGGSRAPTKMDLPYGMKAVALGQAVPNSSPPDLLPIEAPKLEASSLAFTKDLNTFFWRETHTSSVLWGEDEGSQRSGETLAVRMWPSTAHADQERVFWDTGMGRIAWIILSIVSAVGITGLPAVPKDFKRRLQTHLDWQPQIPRDRDALVQEINTRVNGNTPTMSPQTAMAKLGDIRDIPKELKEIEDFMLFKAKANTPPTPEGDSSATDGKDAADKAKDSKPTEKTKDANG